MKIKQIILEGFKSYAQRTVIKDFDKQFNAVTGFNGSGKSNIMDSIMFVLGLSKDWDILRVQGIKELIYKSGHAGITKAEATIIFDNSDKSTSPMGYEDCSEITVTRQVTLEKSKYFVNGTNKTQNVVKNMFRSCQLNIDNPHFYVAQGRITKIINLKSSELISMLEETAGTALYNEKKKESQKIILKKEEKVKEINDMIEQDIMPQIKKVRSQREQYLLWKSQESELIRLTKLIKSFEYYSKNKTRQNKINQVEVLREDKGKLNDERQLNAEQLEQVINELKEFNNKHSIEQSNQSKQVDAQLIEAKKTVAKKQTEVNNRKKRIEETEAELVDLEKQGEENNNQIQRGEDKIIFMEQQLTTLENQKQEKQEQLEESQNALNQAKKGNMNTEDARNNVQKSINDAKQHLESSKFTINQLNDGIKYLERDTQDMKQNLQNLEQEGKERESQVRILQQEIEGIQQEVDQSDFNENEFSQLRHNISNLENDLMQVQHNINNFYSQGNWMFKLNYRNPEPNFDRSKVKGRIFSLFDINEERFLKALEIGAGGRLLNIVVDNEITSKALLKNKCFDFGVSCIPNNKIQYQTPSKQTQDYVQSVCNRTGGWASLAVDCISFHQSIKQSILHIFGGFYICSNAEVAKAIANNQQRNLRYKCVTIDGDVFETGGVLSGGYINNNNMLLAKNESHKQLLRQQDELQSQLKRTQDEYETLKRDQAYYNGLRSDLEQKTRKLEYIQRGSGGLGANKIKERIQGNGLKIQDKFDQIKRTEILCKQCEKEVQDLTNELQSYSNNTNFKDIYTNKIKKLKVENAEMEKQIKKMKATITQNKVDIQNAKKNIDTLNHRKQEESNKLETERSQIQQDQKTLKVNTDKVKTLMAEKEQIEKQINQINKQTTKLQHKKDSIEESQKKLDEDLKKIEMKLNKYVQDIKQSTDLLQDMEKNFTWINSNKDIFGEPGTEFDYTDFNYERQCSKYQQMKLDQDKLSKKVSFTVEATSENVEKKFADLKEKREKITADKSIIVTNMEDLDKKRQQTLEKCYLQVNENFGKIFSDLLPNAFAKLSPLEGKTIDEGLELNVKLGKAWRNSLSELSGGQRSLLALSFVLSLLLYKPAPFYILDEVDAALDTSHTENIGHMVSQRFPQSQFLIISHKEGMYQNANVLFKTSIVDGNSRVDRFQFQSKGKK